MSRVLSGFAVLLAIIATGYLLGRLELLGADAPSVLARLSFYVATPALMFLTLAGADAGALLTSALVAAAGSVVVAAGGYVLVARALWRRSAPEVAVGALSASYVNAGNLGIAVAVYVLGDATAVAPVLLFQLLVMAPIALAVLEPPAQRSRGWLLGVVAQPLRVPVTVGSGLGLLLNLTGATPPPLLLQPVELVGATAVPLALLAFGLSLPGAPPLATGDARREVWLVVALKNVVQPAAAYLIARFALQLDGATLLGVTVVAALPTAQNVFVYAATYGRGVPLARDAVLVTTVLSVPVLVLVAGVA